MVSFIISFYIGNILYQEFSLDDNNKEIISNVIEYKPYQSDCNWYIEIPAIELVAPIANGTDSDVLNMYVGHFEETETFNGNIGLAAHNRGFSVNYFQKLKELKSGDEIYYYYQDDMKKYKVIVNTQIDDFDWSYLQNSDENKITLITCIENKPKYRRCVQAIESEEYI